MAKKDNGFLKQLLAIFAVEAEEHLNAISAGLLELEKAPVAAKQKELIEIIFREAHSLKGAARAVDQTDIESVCQPLESVFSALKLGELAPSPALFDLFHQTVNGLEQLLSSPGAKRTTDEVPLFKSLVQRLQGALSGIDNQGTEFETHRETMTPDSRAPTPGTVRISTAKLESLFRQAEEMIAAKLNAEQRSKELRVITASIEGQMKSWEGIRNRLRAIQPMPGVERPKDSYAGGVISIAKLSEVLDSESSFSRSLAERLGALTITVESDRRMIGKMIDNLLEDAKGLLMQPLSTLFEVLPKIARDLARDQRKEVELVIRGAEIEIDRRIQEEIKDPLIHLLRNCISHGIETPADRVRKNKPAHGTITVTISQKDARRAELVISDDGAGIDAAQVISVAQKLGIVSPAEASTLTNDDAISLVFRSGISTSSVVTDIAGRGLGLAIVQEKIEKLGGTIHLESQRDAGTTFHIVLPLTLASFRGVVVRTGDQFFVLPTASVERVARIERQEIKTVENRETVRFNGHALSLVNLADVLGIQGKRKTDKPDAFVRIAVLAAGGEHIAFIVDEVLNEQEVLLKGLGTQLSRVRNIAGATVLGTGTTAPVLNVPDLMKSSVRIAVPAAPEAKAETGETQGKSILVVEDSITARALLKNILESSGYEVKAAVDGVDALTTLKTGHFDLVVSDIEMPRMDGFDMTARIRADKKLAELPVVLVTALSSREDRERGIDAGANAYIVKSSFDQTNLLEVIRRLI